MTSSRTPLNAARDREGGQVLVLFAFILIGLLLISALAIDYGGWLLARRNYQNVADQAAIAGAYLLTAQIGDDCTPGVSKNHCAREAAWKVIKDSLGMPGSFDPNNQANSIGDVPYTAFADYQIWVASPPSDAGAAYTGFASSTKTIFVRVERDLQAGLSRILSTAPTRVGAWATAGRIPQNFAILTLCGPPTCKVPNGDNIKVNGTGSTLILLSGDIGSNSFGKTAGSSAAIALAPESSAYMHFPGQCTITSIGCQLVYWDDATQTRGARRSAIALPQVVDPNYIQPIFSSTATPWQCYTYGAPSTPGVAVLPGDLEVAADGSDMQPAAAIRPAPEQQAPLAAWPPAGTGIYGQVTEASTTTGLNNIEITAFDGVTTYPIQTSAKVSGVDGRYSFTTLPPGTYTVTAHDPAVPAGYGDLQYTGIVVTTGVMTTLNFSLTPNPGTISGAISGAVVSGITVSTDNGASAVTDGSGNYTITGVAYGSRTVTPTAPVGYSSTPTSRSVTLPAGGTVTGVNFSIAAVPTGDISGTVTDETTNLPIEGAVVTITSGPSGSDTTDANGFYSITNIETGTNYRVTATASGYTNEVSGNFNLTTSGHTENLAMWPAHCGTGGNNGRWDCGNGAGGCPSVTVPSTSGTVSCASFNNTNRIRPGTYERITISNNECAWIDPIGGKPGLTAGQSAGIIYVTDQLNVGSNAFIFGDGVTIFLAPGAEVNVNNSGGFVLNYQDLTAYYNGSSTYCTAQIAVNAGNCRWRTQSYIGDTGVTICAGDTDGMIDMRKGAWTTKARYVWDTSVDPPCYKDEPIDVAEIGMTWFLRGSPTVPHRFDVSGLMGFLFDGVLYGPKDDIGLGGQGAQAAAGQIVAWTITYGGDTDIVQRYSGLETDGPPYLIEPFIGE